MPVQKIVVKVSIHCEKCKQDVFKAVTKLTGIDQVSLDGETGLLTIIGTVNPVEVVERLREKTKKRAYIETVGPVEAAKPPDPPKPPEPDPVVDKKPPPPDSPPKHYYNYNSCHNNWEFVGFAYGPLPDEGDGRDCTIL